MMAAALRRLRTRSRPWCARWLPGGNGPCVTTSAPVALRIRQDGAQRHRIRIEQILCEAFMTMKRSARPQRPGSMADVF